MYMERASVAAVRYRFFSFLPLVSFVPRADLRSRPSQVATRRLFCQLRVGHLPTRLERARLERICGSLPLADAEAALVALTGRSQYQWRRHTHSYLSHSILFMSTCI